MDNTIYDISWKYKDDETIYHRRALTIYMVYAMISQIFQINDDLIGKKKCYKHNVEYIKIH